MRKIILCTLLSYVAINNLVFADIISVNCDAGGTVSTALNTALPGDVIQIAGTCHELLVIDKDNITLSGMGDAVIDGAGLFTSPDVLQIDGARGVAIKSLSVQGGIFGITLQRSAEVNLDNVSVSNNFVMGVNLVNGSSMSIKDVVISNNGVNGIEALDNSSIVVTGSLQVLDNNVFGIDVIHNSSLRMQKATVDVHGNIVGVQIGIGSSGFIEDGNSMLDTSSNDSIGLTVVSTSSFFVFKGKIISNNNGSNDGIALFSNSSIDFDREAVVEANGNGRDGILLEGSLLNIVRMPGEAPSISVVGNGRNGMSALLMSKVDFATESTLTASENMNAGLFVDNGSSAHLVNASLTNNGSAGDLLVTFAGRVDITTSNIGKARCDKSALLRGDKVKCKKIDDD